MKITKKLILLILLFLFCFSFKVNINAYENDNYLSEDLLDNKISEFINENIEQTPSVSITVFNADSDIYKKIYGYANIEDKELANEDTVYEWGSITKVLVWVSAMQLYERGLLDLNANILNYLPKDYLKNISLDDNVTMIDLMNHSSGYSTIHKEMETNDVNKIISLEECLKLIEPGQKYDSGEVVAYSNYGAALAGYIVECISGMSFSDYVHKNIFDKLGMEKTSILPDLSDNEWVFIQRKKTHCYFYGENGLTSLGECRLYAHIYPAGAACGTMSDLVTFAKCFLMDSKDCPLFEKDNTLNEMLSPTKYYSDEKTPRFCHGLMAELSKVLLIGHGGSTEGFSSLMQFDLESKTGFVVLINKQLDRIYKQELGDLIYGSIDIDSIKDNNVKDYDLSGYYVISGGILESGCFRIYNFFNDIMHINKINGIYSSLNRGVVSIEVISNEVALVKLINGVENIYFINSDNDTIISLENPSIDFIKISSFEYYFSLIIAYSLLISIILIISTFALKLILNIKNKTKQSYNIYEKIKYISLLILTISITLLFMIGILSNFVSTFICIFISISSISLIISSVLCMIKSFNKINNNKKFNKLILIIEYICIFFMVISVIYWNLYQFWNF